MSNIFKNKETAKGDNIDEDFIGGGGILDTDLYTAIIKTAYLSKSKKGATAMNLIMNIGKQEVKQTVYMTNRNGDVTYTDKKTGETKNLPGFSQITALCLLVIGKEVGDMDQEEMVVKIYDYESKKELPQSVDCFVELHGETVQIALQRQTVDKNKKNESTGEYEPTGETRDENEVVKFFASDKLVTISEVNQFIKSLGGNFDDVVNDGEMLKAIGKMDDDQGVYAAKWVEKNKGVTYDKSSGSKKSSGGGKEFKKTSEKTAKKKNDLFA